MLFSPKPPPTDDTLGKGLVLESGEAQVSDLNGAGGARDEDVVTLEVAVDDRGCARMEEEQALQDLAAPILQHLHVDFLEPLDVPGGAPSIAVVLFIWWACERSIHEKGANANT